MGIPDHLTCLLKNLYAGQEATVRTGHGTTDWFQIEKGYYQILSRGSNLAITDMASENDGIYYRGSNLVLLGFLP